MTDCAHPFKIIWCKDSDDGFMGKVVGIEDSEVVADCREALSDALLEHIDRFVDEAREAAGAPYKEGKIQIEFEEISREEFLPFLDDEEWDEEDEEEDEV